MMTRRDRSTRHVYSLETLEGRALMSALTAVPAPPAEVAPLAHRLPFSGTTVGSFQADPVTTTGVFSVTTTSSGHLSHLGKVTLTTHDTTIFTSPTSYIVINGTGTFTADDGDQISLTYTGSAVVSSGESMDTLNFVVTGGTGRFAHATGGGTVHAASDFATRTSTLTFEGTISSVGPDRR
jgi:hypothetical protein